MKAPLLLRRLLHRWRLHIGYCYLNARDLREMDWLYRADGALQVESVTHSGLGVTRVWYHYDYDRGPFGHYESFQSKDRVCVMYPRPTTVAP